MRSKITASCTEWKGTWKSFYSRLRSAQQVRKLRTATALCFHKRFSSYFQVCRCQNKYSGTLKYENKVHVLGSREHGDRKDHWSFNITVLISFVSSNETIKYERNDIHCGLYFKRMNMVSVPLPLQKRN